jgi:2,5-diketo-D-gluconate reductase A
VSAVPAITLNDGNEIPLVGIGVFQIAPHDTAAAVATALEIGYRHIDTAQMYGNERGVGDGIRAAGVERGDVFVTSKLSNSHHRPDDARRSFDRTLEDLGFDYVDLFLIHWPLPMLYDGDFVGTWKVLETFQRDGRARSIGVSNFQTDHLEGLAAAAETVPAVNQIEVHPYFHNAEVRRYGDEHGIVTQAWSPIAQGRVLSDPVLHRIANDHAKTAAQVVLRWHIQHGNVVFPKSVKRERMAENIDVFDFTLHADEMAAIDGLDQGELGRTGPHPDQFDYLPA